MSHICSKCTKTFSNKYTLFRHQKNVICRKPVYFTYLCVVCKSEFLSKELLINHNHTEHNSSKHIHIQVRKIDF